MKPKIKWVKEVPEAEGYYWASYNPKEVTFSSRNRRIVPCRVTWISRPGKKKAFVVYVMEGGMFCSNNPWKTVRYGPAIPFLGEEK